MEIRIQAIHFDASEKLEKFIQKKVSKLEQYYDGIIAVEVSLKVVKPETAQNKEAGIKVLVPRNEDIFSCKVADTFEEAVAISTQGIRLHQQTHLKHAVHIFFGDAGNHQALFGQDGDQALLLQTAQCIPHGSAADVAHFRAEFLLIQKLVGPVLTVQDLGFQVLISLQLQARLGLGFHFFHRRSYS